MVPAPPHPEPVRAAVPESVLEAARALAPARAEVLTFDDDLDLSTIDFLVPRPRDHRIIEALPGLERLAVVQTLSAGTDWIADHVPPQATLCSARGARDAPVAEWVLGALLGASTRLLERAPVTSWGDPHPLTDLGGSTVVIVGMGSIGRLAGAWLRALDVEVIGVASRARDDLHGVDELPRLLPRADAVVVLAPLTDATRGLIGAAELAAMRDGALLVNAARGAVVDTDALVPEVQSGRLRAVLDVTDPEPLTDGHPLWTAPGVLSITPHIAGDSARGNARSARLAAEQLVRFCDGDALHNVERAGR